MFFCGGVVGRCAAQPVPAVFLCGKSHFPHKSAAIRVSGKVLISDQVESIAKKTSVSLGNSFTNLSTCREIGSLL